MPIHPTLRILFLGGGLLSFLLLLAPKIIQKSHRADFERYYVAGCVAARRGDIYQAGADLEFKYLPFFAQLMAPLAMVSEGLATGRPFDGPTPRGLYLGATIWFVVLACSYLGSLLLTVLLCRPSTRRDGWWIAAFAFLFSARFANDNLRLGQVNMPVMFLALLGAYFASQEKARKKIVGAIVIAIAAAIKFMPVLLLLWLLWKRWYFAFFTGLFSLFVILLLVPSLTWEGGIGANIAQLKGYWERRHRMVTDLPAEEAAGQSLPSLVNRLFRRVNAAPLRPRMVDGQVTREPIYICWVELDRATCRWIAGAAIGIAMILVGWMIGRSERHGVGIALEIGAIFLLMLIVSPEARKAHYVTMLIPAGALAAVGLRRPRAWGVWIVWGLAFMASFLSSQEVSMRLVGGEFPFYANAYGILLGSAILLLATIGVYLRKPSSPAPSHLIAHPSARGMFSSWI